MKTLGFATLLAMSAAPADAGEGRVVFVCEAQNAATCELAAQRFEMQSRAHGWHLAGRAATVEELDADQLALAMIVVTIDAELYRRWLLSIRRLEAWTGVPSAARDRAAAEAEIERRLATLTASFPRRDTAAD